jgi:hypothetical protein
LRPAERHGGEDEKEAKRKRASAHNSHNYDPQQK